MFVCMHVYIHTCIHMYTYIHACMHTCMCMYAYIASSEYIAVGTANGKTKYAKRNQEEVLVYSGPSNHKWWYMWDGPTGTFDYRSFGDAASPPQSGWSIGAGKGTGPPPQILYQAKTCGQWTDSDTVRADQLASPRDP